MTPRKILVLVIILIILLAGILYFYNSSVARISSSAYNRNFLNNGKPVSNNVINLSSDITEDKLYREIAENAKAGNLLIINKCNGYPQYLNFKKGDTLYIQNKDNEEHTISISAKYIYKVSAKESLKVEGNIEPAIYSYTCMTNGVVEGSRAGVLSVIP